MSYLQQYIFLYLNKKNRFPSSFIFRKPVNKLFLNNFYDYINFLYQKTVKSVNFMILSTLSGSKYLRIVINLLFHLNLKERVHQNCKNTQPIEFRYCFIRFSPYKSLF